MHIDTSLSFSAMARNKNRYSAEEALEILLDETDTSIDIVNTSDNDESDLDEDIRSLQTQIDEDKNERSTPSPGNSTEISPDNFQYTYCKTPACTTKQRADTWDEILREPIVEREATSEVRPIYEEADPFGDSLNDFEPTPSQSAKVQFKLNEMTFAEVAFHVKNYLSSVNKNPNQPVWPLPGLDKNQKSNFRRKCSKYRIQNGHLYYINTFEDKNTQSVQRKYMLDFSDHNCLYLINNQLSSYNSNTIQISNIIIYFQNTFVR